MKRSGAIARRPVTRSRARRISALLPAIASHANEMATQGGKLLPNTKTATFKAATKVPVHVPLSGKTMEFDADGKCVGGC